MTQEDVQEYARDVSREVRVILDRHRGGQNTLLRRKVIAREITQVLARHCAGPALVVLMRNADGGRCLDVRVLPREESALIEVALFSGFEVVG
jgi:hypothetical protein